MEKHYQMLLPKVPGGKITHMFRKTKEKQSCLSVFNVAGRVGTEGQVKVGKRLVSNQA